MNRQFLQEVLFKILNETHLLLKHILNTPVYHNNDNIPVFNIGLEVYFRCLSYRFNISYTNFDNNMNLDDVSIIIFPVEFKRYFTDNEFLGLLIQWVEKKVDRLFSL